MTASVAMTAPAHHQPTLTALTGLRAVAALAVVLSHTGLPGSAPHFLHQVVGWGYVGVPLFFMLSGVVLAYNYPDLHLRERRRTARFYIARLARVMPLYWLMIAYCAVIYYATDQPQRWRALAQNLLAVQTWSPDVLVAQQHYNGPGWSVGIELFFYLLFPAAVPLVAAVNRRWQLRGLLALLGSCVAVSLILYAGFVVSGRADLPTSDPASAHRWLYRNPLPHLTTFVVGLVIAFLLPHTRRWTLRTHHLVQAGVVLYVVGLAGLRGSGAAWSAGSYSTFFLAPFALLLLSLGSGRGWFARWLSTPALVSLGAASYALYITHRWLLPQLTTTEAISQAEGLAAYASLALSVGLMLAIAEGAHRYVEEPARRWIVRRAAPLTRLPTPTAPGPTASADRVPSLR